MEIRIDEIKPIGRFDKIMEKLNEKVTKIEQDVHAKGEYDSVISEAIKKIVNFGFIDAFEETIADGTAWDEREAIITLLYVHLLIMRLNNLAQKYLNKWLTMPSNFEQLNKYITETGKFTPGVYDKIKLVREDGYVPVKVVHCKKEPYDVYIGRPSKWGNPYTHKKSGSTRAKYVKPTRDEAIEAYRDYIEHGEGVHLLNDLHELKGKTLGCWCKPKSCHGDILAELVEKYCN